MKTVFVLFIAGLGLSLPNLSSSKFLNPKSHNILNTKISKHTSNLDQLEEKKDDVCTSPAMFCKGGAIATSSELSLPVLKILLQMLLSGLNIASWGLPLLSKNFSQNALALSRANTFAGGIFLSLSFGHLIPHALEVCDAAGLGHSRVLQFTLIGLLLVFFIEKVAFNSHEILHEAVASHSHAHHSHAASHDHSHDHQSSSSTSTGTADDCNICNLLPATDSTGDQKVLIRASKGSLSTKSAYLLLFAMSLHSLFETMALGLAADQSSSIFMAVSIALHQPAESIALLIAFLKTNMSASSIVKWLSLFSLIGPIGVTAGVYLQRISTPIVQALVVALTAGTFLYLGASEVMNEEFEGIDTKERWLRFTCLLGGIFTVYAVDMVSPP